MPRVCLFQLRPALFAAQTKLLAPPASRIAVGDCFACLSSVFTVCVREHRHHGAGHTSRISHGRRENAVAGCSASTIFTAPPLRIHSGDGDTLWTELLQLRPFTAHHQLPAELQCACLGKMAAANGAQNKAQQDPSVSTQPNAKCRCVSGSDTIRDQTRLSIAVGHELPATLLRR